MTCGQLLNDMLDAFKNEGFSERQAKKLTSTILGEIPLENSEQAETFQKIVNALEKIKLKIETA